MVDKVDIKQYLINLGLDEDEALCYKTLTQSPVSMPVTNLSKEIDIPRSTVYRICENLVKKRFAMWVVGERGREIQAIDSQQLDFLIKEKRGELQNVKKTVHALQEMLGSITTLPKTKVKYYQGKEGIKQIIWNTLRAEKEVIGYSEFGRIAVTGESFYEKYVQEFKLRNIEDKAISNEHCIAYYKENVVNINKNHQMKAMGVRIIPEETFYVSGDHSIYNDTYAISYWKGSEVVGVEIENSELVKMHKSIFSILWNIAKPVSEFVN